MSIFRRHRGDSADNPEPVHYEGRPVPEESVTRTTIVPRSVTSARIPDGAIQSGDLLEELRNGDPKTVEALILTALSRTTLNGMTDLGMDQARRFPDIYRQYVIEQQASE